MEKIILIKKIKREKDKFNAEQRLEVARIIHKHHGNDIFVKNTRGLCVEIAKIDQCVLEELVQMGDTLLKADLIDFSDIDDLLYAPNRDELIEKLKIEADKLRKRKIVKK
jgi:hypothetical protein